LLRPAIRIRLQRVFRFVRKELGIILVASKGVDDLPSVVVFLNLTKAAANKITLGQISANYFA
jgi:hypothetical protein